MADIQPKNTDTIRVNAIQEKTAASSISLKNITKVDDLREYTGAAGVSINQAYKVTSAAALVPLTSTIDIGTSTAASHVRQTFTKKVTSNGQALTIGTDSANNVDVQTSASTKWSFSGADLAQDGTNGGSITLTKASTCVVPGVATTGLTAAGTTISDALALTAAFNNLTTVAASTGVKLWDAPLNSMIVIRNQGANALLVYPHNSGTATINGGAAGASVSVAAATLNIFWRTSSTGWIGVEFVVAAA